MVVEAWRSGRVPVEAEQPAIAAMAADLAELFASASTPERRGLYVASANAGFASSLAFWSGATREGVAYASPALFPWTLSNAPCGWLAREFGLRGPNVTHTGRADALGAALHQCWHDLDQRQADVGWVVAVDFGSGTRQPTTYAAMRVSDEIGPAALERSGTTDSATRLRASAVLTRALAGAARRGRAAFSDGHTLWSLKVNGSAPAR
jgi:3-oxoacyl-(acyl-carrier-protein) synthase